MDNDHFCIERSVDAVEFFEVGRLPGAGDSQLLLHYSFIDHEPKLGLSYYRLKQVDEDGSAFYSNIVPVLMRHLMITQNGNVITINGLHGAVVIINSLGQQIASRSMYGAPVSMSIDERGVFIVSAPESGLWQRILVY